MPRLPLVALLPALGLCAVAALPASAPSVSATAATGGTHTVRYGGVQVDVPADWPVVDFTRDPVGCVRYDRHAVYIGTPQVSDCPAHLVGATQTVQVAFTPPEPGARTRTRTSHGLVETRSGAASSAGTLQVLGDAGTATVTMTDAGDDTTSRAVADSVQHLRAASPAAPTLTPILTPAAATTASAGYVKDNGFDACAAPSAAQLHAWLASPYRTVGVYVGGINRACSQPNLTASWVTQVTGTGWTLIPTYVGLQAPCWSGSGSKIAASNAAAQGVAAADDAVRQMAALGLGPGNPVYDDMESYSTSNTSCTNAVETFQASWTKELHKKGYVSGFYSSAASGITSMVQKSTDPTYTLPDDIWIAHWDGVNTTNDSYVPSTLWANHQRVRQYRGGHNETYGGITINIDSDAVDGAVGTPAQAQRVTADVNGDGRSDLCVLLGQNGATTSSGKLEIHCLNGASLYGSHLYDAATPYSYITTHYQVPMSLDADGDGRSDACVVSGLNGGSTPSGHLEVHCASAASGFATSTTNAVTPWGRSSTHVAYPVALDVNGDGRTDLCEVSGIDGHTTTSGHVELDCLDGATGYTTVLLHAVTVLSPISTWAQLPMGLDVDGDGKTDLCLLSGINGYSSTSGKLQLTCVTAAAAFAGPAVVRPTAFGYLDTRTTYPIPLDVNGDGRTDLCELTGLNGSTTSSGRLELHCVNGATSFTSTLIGVATADPYERTAAVSFLGDAPVDVDLTAPVPHASSASLYSLASPLVFSLSATETQSGVQSYDVRYRAAPYSAGFSGYVYPSYLQGVTATSVGINAARGTTVCISVRARDRVRNLSGWSSETCGTAALDDRDLAASSGWTRGTGSAFYNGTLSSTAGTGRVLTRTGLATRRLALVATTCPKCGTVGVYWNGVLLRKVSLVSPTYQNKKLLYVQLFSAVVTGNVTVKTLTNQVVYVDGLATSQV